MASDKTIVPISDRWRLIVLDRRNWALQGRSAEAAEAEQSGTAEPAAVEAAWRTEGYYPTLALAATGTATRISEEKLQGLGALERTNLLELARELREAVQGIEDAVLEAVYLARRS